MKIIKCKFETLSIDISINNFIGLSKLILLNFADLQFSMYFEFNPFLFRRTLILIKSWCLYEGLITGSNIGLLASYAIEVLVIYLFNNFHKSFKNEFEAFVEFFKVIKKIDWENFSISIEGQIPLDITEEEKLLDFLQEQHKPTDQIFTMKDFVNFYSNYKKYREIEKMQQTGNFNSTNNISSCKNILNIKFFNILDPLSVTNNIGRSVNFQNFSKIKKVFELISKDLDYIVINRNKYNPYNYLNMLLRLFKKTLSSKYPEIFYMTMLKPKIVINPNVENNNDNDNNLSNRKSDNFSIKENSNSNNNSNNFFKASETNIKLFNKKFSNNSFNLDFIFSNKDEISLNEDIFDSGISATNEIIEKFFEKIDKKQPGQDEDYNTICVVDDIEEFINKLVI